LLDSLLQEMLSALRAALADLKEILKSARENAIDGKDVPGKMFLPAVEIYKKLYDDLHVKTTEEYKEKIFQVNDEEVKVTIQQLESLEKEWNGVLATLDPEIECNASKTLTEGGFLTEPVKLQNVSTGENTDIKSVLSTSSATYIHFILLRYLS